MREIERALDTLSECRCRLFNTFAARAELAELKKNLKSIEWVHSECPACRGLSHQVGHKGNCWLAKIIGR